jgi:hypothetical protein
MTLVTHAILGTLWSVDLKDAILRKYDPVVEVLEDQLTTGYTAGQQNIGGVSTYYGWTTIRLWGDSLD